MVLRLHPYPGGQVFKAGSQIWFFPVAKILEYYDLYPQILTKVIVSISVDLQRGWLVTAMHAPEIIRPQRLAVFD